MNRRIFWILALVSLLWAAVTPLFAADYDGSGV